MKANQAEHRVATLCRVLGVSTSGYYAWISRPPSKRARRDEELRGRVRAIYERSRGTYGSPRIHAELADDGERVGRKRVARVMREDSLQGATRRKRVRTTKRRPEAQPAPDLVRRDFHPTGPDELWVADITYVPTWSGFLYLAVVLDAWSRKIVGWSMATHLRTELVLNALDMAITQRRPSNVIHHSDQGTQGRFNRSSQHLKMEVLYGKATGLVGDTDRAPGDEVAGQTAGAARCGAEVLDEDRGRFVERAGSDCLRSVGASRRAVVS